jgi:hypothetical protein
MSRIYAPNEDYNQKGIGIEFYYGAAVSTVAAVIANLQAKGYTIDATTSTLSIFDKLPKSELVDIATKMGLVTTKIVDTETVDKTKQELIAAIESFVNKGILPYVSNVASSGLTNLVLTFSEALYDGANAVANNADLKAKFAATAGVTITSAVYTTADKKITFILADVVETNTLTYTGNTLKDAAGGKLDHLSYTAGAEEWAVTA